MLVIGPRDMEAGNVSLRLHGKGNQGAKPKDEVIADIFGRNPRAATVNGSGKKLEMQSGRIPGRFRFFQFPTRLIPQWCSNWTSTPIKLSIPPLNTR